jgi:aspartate-semialdehyde dehydrogenase
MKKIKAAVLGCTGLVGNEFVRLLADHPYFALALLTASGRSAGKAFAATAGGTPAAWMGAGAGAQVIRETSIAAVMQSGARVVFSALPAGIAAELETELRRRGLFVFSNAGAHRMDADVPLLIPEANAEHLALAAGQRREFTGFIVTNPNCVVAGLALALKPLAALQAQAVTVTTFQAVSGGGRRGVAAWDILGNVIPHIAGEEEKIGREARKILGVLNNGRVCDHELEIYPSCSRVAVREGHLQSVSVEFAAAIGLDAVENALSGFTALPQRLSLPTAPRRPLLVQHGADRPQPALDVNAGEPERARGMAVTVGRLRVQGRRCRFFLLVHNTVRGAAGGSLLNAELALKTGLLPGVTHE